MGINTIKNSTQDEGSRPLAFLVDGDNASFKLIGDMLDEASKHGSVRVRRVYGDWTSKYMENWKKALHEHALSPIQQFPNIRGKNATDSALIIDAMDLLHAGIVQGFCIVSSDSDYTRLATRIREDGLFVMAIGEKKTPDALMKACDVFVLTDNLEPRKGSKGKAGVPRELILKAFDNVEDEDGYAAMASLGQALLKIDPSFDPRTYGKSKLVSLIESLPGDFKIERRGNPVTGAVFLRRTKK